MKQLNNKASSNESKAADYSNYFRFITNISASKSRCFPIKYTFEDGMPKFRILINVEGRRSNMANKPFPLGP